MTSTETAILDVSALEEAAEAIVPLPAAIARLITVVNDPNVNVGAIVEIVRYDIGLTAALLRQANSAHYVAARQVSDVRDAIVRLGLNTVLTVAMRSAVAASLSGALEIYNLEGGDMYRHSVLAAVAADEIRMRRPNLVPSITPTVALLHDVGKIVIAKAIGGRARELMTSLATADGHAMHETEVAVFGMHHGHAGAYVIRHWKLPDSFIDGIVNHHGSDAQPTFAAMGAQLADELAHASDALRTMRQAHAAGQTEREETARQSADSPESDTTASAESAEIFAEEPTPAVRPSEALVSLCERFAFGADEIRELIATSLDRYEDIRASLEQ